MEITNILTAKLTLAKQVLSDLIEHYPQLNDSQRLEKANVIMDEINSYLQIKENLLFPFIRQTGLYPDLIERSALLDREIERLTELSIMMHVDEPGGAFCQNMILLRRLLERAEKNDRDSVLAWAQEYLKAEEQEAIASQVKYQTRHEAFSPASGTLF